MEKLSIIIPIYKVEKYLRQCLESVVNQTYKTIEIILIDDGSPDNCGAICDEYASADDRVVVIHKKNAGVSAARNDGIAYATGKWIMFVDPDDWLALDCCSKVMELAEKVNTDVIYFQIDINNEEGKLIYKFPEIGSKKLNSSDLKKLQLDDLSGNVESLGFESGSPWGRIFRRKFLNDHDCRFPIGVKRRQDLLFNLYCLEYLREAYFFDYIGYHNRINSNSICHRYNQDMMEILLDYLSHVEEFVKEFHKGEELYEKMIGIQAINIHGDLRTTLFCNVIGIMPVKEYLTYMDMYYADPVVKRYLNKLRIRDFRTFKDKICFWLISRHHVYMYYYMSALVRRFKL